MFIMFRDESGPCRNSNLTPSQQLRFIIIGSESTKQYVHDNTGQSETVNFRHRPSTRANVERHNEQSYKSRHLLKYVIAPIKRTVIPKTVSRTIHQKDYVVQKIRNFKLKGEICFIIIQSDKWVVVLAVTHGVSGF